jgi:translation elongation factor EF-Tu-like GTPase
MTGRLAEVEVTFLPQSRGGRIQTPDLNGGWYRPHFRVLGDTEYLGVQFMQSPKHDVHPEEPIRVTVCLTFEPQVSYEKLIPGATFEILEGARVVGRGQVLHA